MTIQQLQVFMIVCKYMNYSQAAAELYMTRQAVRKNIQALEEDVHAPLFKNMHNHLTLTERGQYLKNHALPVLRAWDKFSDSLQENVRLENPLRLSISHSLVPDFLIQLDTVLDTFAEKHPGLPIETASSDNASICDAILRGDIDAGLIMTCGAVRKGLFSREIISFPAGFMYSRSILPKRRKLTVSDLEGHTLILPGKTPEFAPLFTLLEKADVHPKLHVIPYFYQVNYEVREHQEIGMTRYVLSENDTPKTIGFSEIPGITIDARLVYKKRELASVLEPLVRELRNYYRRIFQKDTF